MNKFLKLIIFIAVVILICGCENGIDDDYEDYSNDNEIISNIQTDEVRFFNGEYNDKNIVLNVQNNNNKPVYLNYSFEMFDKKNRKLYNKEVIVRVGKNDSAYVICIQDLEEESFDSYSYNISVLKEQLEDYDRIKKNIKYDYKDDGKKITVTLKNNGSKTTTVYGVLLFYKSSKLVAVKQVTAYNLIPKKEDIIKIDYPIKKINQKISFDKIELVINEVSTEL